MPLLKPATNQTGFLKLGMLGFEGSGKTYTAIDFAVGITKLVKGSKVAFYDTEKGSDFHIKRMKEEGLEFFVHKSKSFVDLVEIIKEAEAEKYSFLIIDSITHVWRELTSSYLRRKGRNYLTMPDWGILKSEWAQFTDLYVNSKLHIAMLGRAGYEYDTSQDDDGKQQVVKGGTKMKVETETGFEPDLLLEMYKERRNTVEIDGKKDKKAKGFINACVVLKDRTNTMNATVIHEPKFSDFKSVIDFLNLGGEHVGTDQTRTSDIMFGNPDRSYAEKQKQRDIALEELQATLITIGLDGTSAEAKKKRVELLERIFGTSSKTKLEDMKFSELNAGIATIRNEFGLNHGSVPEPPKFDVNEKLL